MNTDTSLVLGLCFWRGAGPERVELEVFRRELKMTGGGRRPEGTNEGVEPRTVY